ncbi:MAG: MerR [Pseudonocardiaceae bacterium]
MTSYDVTVTREDNLWVALTDNVGATDVEHFPELDVEVRDYIAGMTDADPGDFAIRWRYEVNGRDVTDVLTRFMAAERELRDVMAEEAAKAAERDAARLDAILAVRSAGLSQRVAADVVGLSHQRVHQLVSSQPKLLPASGQNKLV